LKLKEGKESILSGVPKSLPATVKAMRLQEKAKQVGFEWENKEQVWEKVEEEFGDVIFSLINYARFLRIDAENALEVTNKKFTRRFTEMEQQATSSGKSLTDMTLVEMDSIWNSIKKQP
jgi:XTP/dITP diphosphohydrolase